MPRLRHARAALGTAVVVSTLLCVGGIGSVAHARPDDAIEPACSANGIALRYVVLFNAADSEQRADDEVAGACGQMVIYYPQIAVGVVTSRYSRFVDRIGTDRAFSAQAAVGRHKSDETDGQADQITLNPAAVSGIDRSSEQWDMSMIHAPDAHLVTEGSRGVVVGVLDSGVDPNHPDLRGALDPSQSAGCLTGKPDPSRAAWEPTSSPHGTHVAGTIAAADDGHGITGVAPGVRIASVKVVDDGGFIYPEYAICGFIWAGEHHMAVTNNSYFVDPWFKWCKDDPDQKVGFEAVRRAIDFSADRDVVNVAALGNSNWDLAHNVDDAGSPDNGTPIDRTVGNDCPSLPAEVNGVVGVSAVGPTGQKSYYSNYGVGDTEVAAPGGDRFKVPETPDGNGRVLSTITGGGWGYLQGTSMASPHAVGVVALIRSTHPNWNASRVIRALQDEADGLSCPANPYDPTGDGQFVANCQGGRSGRGFYGAGLVDALDAVTK